MKKDKVEILKLDNTTTTASGFKRTEYKSKDGTIYYTWAGNGGVCNPLETEGIKVSICRWYPSWLVRLIVGYCVWKDKRSN